jgi:Sulfotransferase family
LISRPLIILGAPRSGTTMIFQALSTHPELWSLYRESQGILNRHFPTEMVPGKSVLVTADDVDDATAKAIDQEFFDEVGNAEASLKVFGRGVPVPLIARNKLSSFLTKLGKDQKIAPIRMVEKTPDNCFRIQMLRKVFPDAQFVYVVRDPRGSMASIYKGWTEESRFQRFELPPGYVIKDYTGSSWCFGLPPGWEDLDGSTVMEICAHQWRLYNEYCDKDLPKDEAGVIQVRYEEMALDPGPVLREIARFAGIDPQPLERFAEKLPVVNTWSKPSADKWKRVEEQIGSVLPLVASEAGRLGYST